MTGKGDDQNPSIFDLPDEFQSGQAPRQHAQDQAGASADGQSRSSLELSFPEGAYQPAPGPGRVIGPEFDPKIDLFPASDDVLFGADPVATTSAKFAVVESVLRLLVRDIKFPDFVRELLLAVLGAVKSEAGSVLEVDHANQVLFFRAVAGQSSEGLQKFTIPMNQGIAGHVVESRQPLIVSNVKDNHMHLKAIEKAVGFETRNLAALPIIIRGQVYGVLELLNRLGESGFTDSDIELLNYLCSVVAKAIEIRLMIAWVAKAKSRNVGGGRNSQGDAA